MKKLILSMLAAAVAAGCSPSGDKRALKVSVFEGTVTTIAKQQGGYDKAAELLIAAGVTGFDAHYKSDNVEKIMKTPLKPINLFGWPKFLGPDGGVKDADEFVGAAKKWGVPRIMVVPDSFPEGCDQAATFEKILAGVKMIAAKAQAAGIQVTVEDYGGTTNPCSYSKYLKRFLDEVPGLGYALDSGNLYYAGRGEDILDMMRYAKGKIKHVHLKDQTKEDNHKYITIGEGAVPNEEIVRTVWKAGYDGWFTLENLVTPDRITDVRVQMGKLRTWTGNDAK